MDIIHNVWYAHTHNGWCTFNKNHRRACMLYAMCGMHIFVLCQRAWMIYSIHILILNVEWLGRYMHCVLHIFILNVEEHHV